MTKVQRDVLWFGNQPHYAYSNIRWFKTIGKNNRVFHYFQYLIYKYFGTTNYH